MLTRLHVLQGNIRLNRKDGGSRPVITVKTYRSTDHCHGVVMHGPSTLIYRPENPLSCGATVWIETKANVELVGIPDMEVDDGE